MFGTLRFALAMLVVLAHTWGIWRWSGAYAVFAFYTLSGYLMTLIVQEKYGLDARGLGAYATNRLLRIFPAYWFSLICTLAFIYLVAGDAFTQSKVHSVMLLPTELSTWIPNFTLFGLWRELPAIVVPQAWALNIELIYYVAIAAFIGRRPVIASSCLGLSFAYAMYQCSQDVAFAERYFSLVSGALPFSLGATIYFFKDRFKPSNGFRALLVAIAMGHVFIYNPGRISVVDPYGYPLYINVVLFGLVVWAMVSWQPRAVVKSVDHFLGNLSYPIYLNHYLVIGLILWLFPDYERGNALDFLLVGGAVCLYAYGAWRLAERPFEQLRSRIASRSRAESSKSPESAEISEPAYPTP